MEINKVSISDDEFQQIKPINVDTVHKICSGQVVLSLAVAVKELVENSLDAGATNIDIRFKNYGVDLIEVSDNGSGVTEDNFAALTLKYHTSKLNEYSDLLGVTSFGFRGEALSSLCALADLTVTTRHKYAEYAIKIEYDHKGNVLKKTPCSRQIGTTVTLSNLFASLPVRQKEFHKNVKREFNKMTQLLYAYCLISLGVKITCYNQTSTNPKSVVVATQGSTSYKDNIACIFGLKQLQTLLEIKPEYVTNIKDNIFRGISGESVDIEEGVNVEDIEIDLSEDSNDAEIGDKSSISNLQKSQGHKNMPKPVQFTGFISSCEHGSGRSSSDRQFYYVNSRPCEPVKIIKLINEIYRQYNCNQYPFVFLNVDMDRTSVDVNVTPDKRKIFLTKEKLILDTLKSSLAKIFESIPRTLKVESLISNKVTNDDIKPDINKPRVFNAFIQTFANKTNDTKIQENETKLPNTDLKRKPTTILDFISAKKAPKLIYSDELVDSVYNTEVKQEVLNNECVVNNGDETDTVNISVENNHTDYKDIFCDTKDDKNETVNDRNEKREMIYLEFTDNLPNTQIRTVTEVLQEKSSTIYCKTKNANSKLSETAGHKPAKKPKLIVTDKEDLGKHNRRSVILNSSLEHVKALLNIYNQQKGKESPKRIKFRSAIDPVFNKKCEEELSKEISKSNFNQMNVVGQFNLGFIIARLNDDLFIIDQHATDEIFNFEMLQKTTELTTQKLVIPQQLELTGVNEQILMDHLDIFRKNGFSFEINENELPTKRVKLLTIPMSKNWIFGKEDIEELLFMLRESPSEYCRPSRVRAMFASRACRKSVMIGTALSKTDMKKLVKHMAEIDKPWNCPHGRPTIRHLVNLAMVHTRES